MDDRSRLRKRAFYWHQYLKPGEGRSTTNCPWCRAVLNEGDPWDLHEALLKRSDLPREKQHLIMVKENVVPVHHQCHMEHGQEAEMTKRCLHNLAFAVGAQQVGKWYTSLLEMGLRLRKGLLVPAKLVPLVKVTSQYLRHGAILQRYKLDEDEANWLVAPNTKYVRDYRALCARRWAGKTIKKIHRPPTEWNGVHLNRMVGMIWEGYWLDYLAGIWGFQAEEVLRVDSRYFQ